MTETGEVSSSFEVDSKQANQEFDNFNRRVADVEKSGRKAGKGVSAFMSAAVGGVAGFVAGAVKQNDAVSSTIDLVLNIIAATILPIATSLMPAIAGVHKVLAPLADAIAVMVGFLIDKFGADVVAKTALAAYVGYRIGGPGGAAALGALGFVGAELDRSEESNNAPPQATTNAPQAYVVPPQATPVPGPDRRLQRATQGLVGW